MSRIFFTTCMGSRGYIIVIYAETHNVIMQIPITKSSAWIYEDFKESFGIWALNHLARFMPLDSVNW